MPATPKTEIQRFRLAKAIVYVLYDLGFAVDKAFVDFSKENWPQHIDRCLRIRDAYNEMKDVGQRNRVKQVTNVIRMINFPGSNVITNLINDIYPKRIRHITQSDRFLSNHVYSSQEALESILVD